MSSALADRRLLFGLEVDAMTLPEAIRRCEEAADAHKRMLVGVVNAAKIVNLQNDSELRDSLLECDMILPDGQSIVWAGKVLEQPLPERVTGIDLFEGLLRLADARGYTVYLLGARADVLETLVSVLQRRYPNLSIVGWRDGYFTDDEAAEVAADIRATRPDMLFLGMVSPKKEIFLGTFGPTLDVPILHGVGGSFDVMAGVTQRAPRTWQRMGLEWAYRLKQEPRRLWRRYARTNTKFVYLTIKERFKPMPRWTSSVPEGTQSRKEA